MVRLAFGIEDTDDLLGDVEQALEKFKGGSPVVEALKTS
jgi:hypothetical protein